MEWLRQVSVCHWLCQCIASAVFAPTAKRSTNSDEKGRREIAPVALHRVCHPQQRTGNASGTLLTFVSATPPKG